MSDSSSSSSDTRQRLLEAARQVFGEMGYARATTRALAAAAGVTELTLFRHFGSKENLFAAVLEEYAAPAMTSNIEAQLSGNYRQDLMLMGRLLLQVLLQRQESVRLMLCEATHFPELKELMVQNPRRLRQHLAAYLQQKIDQGEVRPLDPEAMAHAFWGMLFSYGISQGMLDETPSAELSQDELLACFVDIFVRGTLAQQE
jgi:AcrR family transcriptional regulator